MPFLRSIFALLAILFCLFAPGTAMATLPAAPPPAALPESTHTTDSQPQAATAPAPAKTTSPGAGLLAALAIVIFIIFLVLAVCFSILSALAFLFLLFIGVVSLTMLVGVLRRSVSAAAKALTIQAFALLGVPVGIAILALLAHFLLWSLNPVMITLLGILTGAASGATVGYLLTKALALLLALLTQKLHPADRVPLQAARTQVAGTPALQPAPGQGTTLPVNPVAKDNS